MYWVQVIADIVHYVFTVFGCPSYFTDGSDILNDSILYSFIAVLCKIWKVFDKKCQNRLPKNQLINPSI